MSARLRMEGLLSAPEEWDRRKLQVALAAAVLICLALLAGVLWAVVDLLGTDRSAAGPKTAPAEDARLQDVGALSIDEAQPGPLATSTTGTLRIPQPGSLGPAQVGTGFRRTPEGALAQLVAIDQHAIQSASVVTAQDVSSAWAEPGGPTPVTWSGVEAVTVLLDAAGLPANGASDLWLELRPAMGLIREQAAGTVTPCIDFVLTATVAGAQPDRIAVADCQRMVWREGRWLIGAGPEPKPSPSLWPGTQASYDAGYLWLEVEP